MKVHGYCPFRILYSLNKWLFLVPDSLINLDGHRSWCKLPFLTKDKNLKFVLPVRMSSEFITAWMTIRNQLTPDFTCMDAFY